MTYVKSMNELEYFAKLIDIDKCPIMDVEKYLDGQTPFEIAYKTAVTLQGSVYFPKEDDRVYENVGKLDMKAITSVSVGVGKMVTRNQDLQTQFHVGYWLISLLFDDDKLMLQKGRFENDVYKLVAKDCEYIDMLFYIANTQPPDVPIHSRPAFKAPKPFTKFTHKVAGEMVRSANKKAKDYFTYENCPEVFDAINKQMNTAYKIDMELLEIYRQLEDDSLFTLEDKNLTEEQRDGIQRELTSTLDIAEGTQGRKFWEYAFYDYRGRIYSSAVWLTHQGGKLSKSLFRLARTSPMGSEGYTYLLVHAANCWGYDKDTMDGRYLYADKHLNQWREWAQNPIQNKGWKKADDPFNFLAAILEIDRAMKHPGGPGMYRSGLIVAWDATCSGLQVLSSLGKSKEEGEYCNITKSDKRGDYYLAIADEVWKACTYNSEEKEDFDRIMKKLRGFDNKLSRTENKDKRKEILNERRAYMKKMGKRLYELSKVYWADKKELRRKLCKRPCMTYFYSCREKTAAKQLKNDWASEPGFEDLNSSFCYWLCFNIIKACEKKMPVSTNLMELMIDMGIQSYNRGHEYCWEGKPASRNTILKRLNEEYEGITTQEDGRVKNKFTMGNFEKYLEEYDEITLNENHVPGGEHFSVVAPRTKFLFMQNYTSHGTKRIRVRYTNKRIQLNIITEKNSKLDYAKIKSATSPNFVHMLDGEIAKAIMLDTEYDVSCIHDSFGVIPANAGKLFEDIRTVFVDLFDKPLLDELMKQKNYECEFKYGELDVKDIIDNDNAFS